MNRALGRLGTRLLFALDPERAHALSLEALRLGGPLCGGGVADASLNVRVCGIDFPNPLGLAAGYDKNGMVPDALLGLGFGFVEVGTVTPLAQAGNPRPRIFRLTADGAVINRLGFNNDGHAACAARLARRRDRPGIVGVNIGANKDSADRIADYRLGVERFAGLASYLTVNISSPNTPGLRGLQARESLAELLRAVREARDGATSGGKPVPIFLKIAPDLEEADLDDIAAEVLDKGIEGVAVSNTTVARPALRSADAAQAGGLSGRPLFDRSTAVLARMRQRLGGEVAIIGVGGVDSAGTALEKIRAGADLVQLYTGMIYGGPGLPRAILRDLAGLARREGVGRIAELRDSATDRWASAPL